MDCSLPGSSIRGILQARTRVGCHALLQGIFPTQGLNLHLLRLLHWQVGSLPLVPPGKHMIRYMGARSQSKPSLPPLTPNPPRGRQPSHLTSCAQRPRPERERATDMAAAKPENLSLVVHGPGDLRLVKLDREWED